MTYLEEVARQYNFSLFNSARDLYESNKELIEESKFYNETQYLSLVMRSRFGGYDGSTSDIDEFREWSSYGNLSRFQNQPLLDRVLNLKNEIEANIDLGGDFESDKLKFTSIPKGVFSFGLASKGLYRLVEYFDTESKRVVSDKLVRSKIVDGIKEFYYNTPKGEKKVRKQQKGSFKVSEACNVPIEFSEKAKMYVPVRANKIVISCNTPNENGEKTKLEFATTIKKVYMYRDKLGGGLSDYVELYLPVSFNGDETTANMLSQNLPLLIVADILESSGIKCRIYGIDFTMLSPLGGYAMAYTVKEFGEKFDLNKITALTSEQRFIRTQAYAQSVVRLAERKNWTQRQFDSKIGGLGRAIEPSESYFRPLWNTYRNWVFNNKGSFEFDTKILDPNLMIIGGAPLVNIESQEDTAMDNAKNEVYRILDYVGMMVSKNKRKFIRSVIERRKDLDGESESYIKEKLKNLIETNTQVLKPINDDLKMYATPPDIARRTKETVDSLIETINEL